MTITRIANFAANAQLVNLVLRTQARVNESQIQVASEKKSQTYSGIAGESERLINIENSRNLLDQFVQNNNLEDIRLSTTDTVFEAIRKAISDFREQVFLFEGGGLDVEQRVKDVQDAAFRALKDIETHLNQDFNGRFLFGGTRVTTQPVDLGLTMLADFQTTYDGTTVVYPVTRDAHVDTSLTTANATTGNLAFNAAANTITAANAGTLSSIPVGTKITVAGAAAANNRDYTVVSNTGTVITVAGTFTPTGGSSSVTVNGSITATETVAATLSVSTYYKGDRVAQTHRVDTNREFTKSANAIDPAFEKAIRAMGIMAQGVFGAAGGLDQNKGRVDDVLYLLEVSLTPTIPANPPYGTETAGNIEQLQRDTGFDRVLLEQTNNHHEALIGVFDARISETENVDKLDAITRLLDDSRALETSYQALARIRELQLADFLS